MRVNSVRFVLARFVLRTPFVPLAMMIASFGCTDKLGILKDARTNNVTAESTSGTNMRKVVFWYEDAARPLLARAAYKADLFELAHRFQPQINPFFCGVASSVMVLNALRGPSGRFRDRDIQTYDRPRAFMGGTPIEFKTYTQAAFLNDRTEPIKAKSLVVLGNITEANTDDPSQFNPGFELAELARILTEAYGLNVTTKRVADAPTTVPEFRAVLKQVLSGPGDFLIADFLGKQLGLQTGGHYSPIAAYDDRSDRLLVMDVAGHRNPWFWVGVKDFVEAMSTKDGENFRGYLVVRENGYTP